MSQLCDANVWVALAVSDHTHHENCRRWLDGIEDSRTIFFCRATQQSFLRLLTTPAILAPYRDSALTNAQAWAVYEAFLADDRIAFEPQEPDGLERAWRQIAVRDSASPKLWMDAYLAAYALAGGHTFVTTDRDFRQFEGLDLLLLS